MSTHIEHRRIILLTLLSVGILSLAIYVFAFTLPYFLPDTFDILPPVDVGKLSQYSTEAGLIYIGAVLMLFVGYALAWVSVRRRDIGMRGLIVVLGMGLVMSVALAYVYPITAIDLFGYVTRGRVFAIHHANPFLYPPSGFPSDPTLPYVGAWQNLASPYGPAWEWLAAAGARLGGDVFLRTLLVFKGIVIVAYALDALLIWVILSRLRPHLRLSGLLFFAWNPLVLLETAANGHNDVVMLLPVLFAIWLLAGPGKPLVTPMRGAFAFTALTLAVWVKFIPLILGPIALVAILSALPTWRARLLSLLTGVSLALLLTVILWRSLWPGVDHLMVIKESGRILFSPAALVVQIGVDNGMERVAAVQWVKTEGLALFSLLYLILLRRTGRGAKGLASGGVLALWLYLLVGAFSFRHWYPVWLLPLAALTPQPALIAGTLVFSLLGELSPAYYTFGYHWWRSALPWPDLVARGIPAVFGLPLAAAIIVWAVNRRKRPGSK